MERHDPRVSNPSPEKTVPVAPEAQPIPTKNSFEILLEPCKSKGSPADAIVVPPQMSLGPAGSQVKVPVVDPSWTQSRKHVLKSLCSASCECTARKFESDSSSKDDLVEATPVPNPSGEEAKTGGKKNQAARRRTRRMVAAAQIEDIKISMEWLKMSDYVVKSKDTSTCFDLLMFTIAERAALGAAN